MKIAVVEKAPNSKANLDVFDFKYDTHYLTDERTGKKKSLVKADVQLDKAVLENYDFVILIGADASKHIAKVTQVTKYAGHLINDKYIPMVNPVMAKIKPEMEPIIDAALTKIHSYIDGSYVSKQGTYIGIGRADLAKKYVKTLLRAQECKTIAVDTETTGLYPRDGYVIGISISHEPYQGVYINADCIDEELEKLLQKLFNEKVCVFHNAKFDLAMLQYHFKFKFPNWNDTMIMHYMLNENEPHDLKYLALKYTDMGDYDAELDTWKREYCRKNSIYLKDFTYDLIPFEILSDYAGKDTDATLRLFHKFNPIITRSKGFSWLYDEFLKPAVKFLQEIEDNGVPFSKDKLLETQVELNKAIEEAKQGLYAYKEVHKTEAELGVIFNPNSTAHLRHLLFNKLKLKPIKKTATGAASTDAETLEHLASKHEIANHILKIRKLQKIKSTYIDKIIVNLDNDSRLRTGFNLTTTTSGRLSSSGKLNMQQLPRDDKRVKKCIRDTREDYLIFSQDLRTAEMYYAAVLSDDKELMKVFKMGGDFHSTIAHTVFNLPCKPEEVKDLYPKLRQASKAISFGILYGAGPSKIAETAGISMAEAKEVINQYFFKFQKLKKWIETTQAEIERNGFVYSVFGRKRRVPNVFSVMPDERGHAVRSALNFLVQSVASDINLMAAIDMHEWLKKNPQVRAEIFALVHDSILGTVHKDDAELVKKKMQEFTQKNRKNVWIPGSPIGVDFELGESYAFES